MLLLLWLWLLLLLLLNDCTVLDGIIWLLKLLYNGRLSWHALTARGRLLIAMLLLLLVMVMVLMLLRCPT